MTRISLWLLAGLSLIALVTVAYISFPLKQGSGPGRADIPEAPAVAIVSPAKAPVPATPPAILNPIETPQPAPSVPLPALGDSDGTVKDALIGLLGRKAVLSFLNLDAFLRDVVATVDNLARDHAASHLWPVVPTPGRFLVLERGDGTYIADGNSERYAGFVALAKSVDTEQAAALYRRFYPLLQQAYEELGYPGKYFNDRLIEVIDQLLATPEPAEPIKVTLTPVQGPYPDTRPWVRYEFADSSLQSSPAGQKILLRMGQANARLIKAKIKEFRNRVATRGMKP